jgi:hypothetical protein
MKNSKLLRLSEILFTFFNTFIDGTTHTHSHSKGTLIAKLRIFTMTENYLKKFIALRLCRHKRKLL